MELFKITLAMMILDSTSGLALLRAAELHAATSTAWKVYVRGAGVRTPR